MVDSVTTYMNKDYHLEQLEIFGKKAKALGLTSIERTVQLATEQVKNNIFWRKNSYYSLQGYLEGLMTHLQINLY